MVIVLKSEALFQNQLTMRGAVQDLYILNARFVMARCRINASTRPFMRSRNQGLQRGLFNLGGAELKLRGSLGSHV